MSCSSSLARVSSRTRLLAALLLSAVAAPAQADLPPVKTEVAFPNLKFDRPVAMESPADGTNRLFVAEQHQAKVWAFKNEANTSEKTLFLDLPTEISRDNEEGLLGLAFHPKFKENGQFFVGLGRTNLAVCRRSIRQPSRRPYCVRPRWLPVYHPWRQWRS